MEHYGKYDGPIESPSAVNQAGMDARGYYGMQGHGDVLARVPDLDAEPPRPSRPTPTFAPVAAEPSSASRSAREFSPRLGVTIGAAALLVAAISFMLGRFTAPESTAAADPWSTSPAPEASVAPTWQGGGSASDALAGETGSSGFRSLPAPGPRTSYSDSRLEAPAAPSGVASAPPAGSQFGSNPSSFAPPAEPPAWREGERWPTPGATAQAAPNAPIAPSAPNFSDRFTPEQARNVMAGPSGATAQYPDGSYASGQNPGAAQPNGPYAGPYSGNPYPGNAYPDNAVRTGANQGMALDNTAPPQGYPAQDGQPAHWGPQQDQRMAFRPRTSADAPGNTPPPAETAPPTANPPAWPQTYNNPAPAVQAPAPYAPAPGSYAPASSAPNVNGYGQPAGGYSQPMPGQPGVGSAQPGNGYGQPTNAYGQPAAGYNGPSPYYQQGAAAYPPPGYGPTGTARFEGVIENQGVRTNP